MCLIVQTLLVNVKCEHPHVNGLLDEIFFVMMRVCFFFRFDFFLATFCKTNTRPPLRWESCA